MITIEIKGLQGLEKKIAKTISGLPEAARMGVESGLKSTAGIAVRLAPGVVAKSIKFEILNADGKEVAGRVFTDTSITSFAPYVEFGTGLKVDDQGNPEAIRLKRAKSIPWYIHVSMVPKSFERYGYPKVKINGQEYWECDGMYPHPYMHPAAFQNRDGTVNAVAMEISQLFRRAGF